MGYQTLLLNTLNLRPFGQGSLQLLLPSFLHTFLPHFAGGNVLFVDRRNRQMERSSVEAPFELVQSEGGNSQVETIFIKMVRKRKRLLETK